MRWRWIGVSPFLSRWRHQKATSCSPKITKKRPKQEGHLEVLKEINPDERLWVRVVFTLKRYFCIWKHIFPLLISVKTRLLTWLLAHFVTETKNHLINYTLINFYLFVFNCVVFNQLLRIYEEQRTKHQIGFTISCGFRSLASCFESSLPSLSAGNFWVDRLPTEPKHSV